MSDTCYKCNRPVGQCLCCPMCGAAVERAGDGCATCVARFENEAYPEYGMDCYVCGKSIATNRGDVDMPAGWGFVYVQGRCADGLPGLEPMYACPDCKDEDA